MESQIYVNSMSAQVHKYQDKKGKWHERSIVLHQKNDESVLKITIRVENKKDKELIVIQKDGKSYINNSEISADNLIELMDHLEDEKVFDKYVKYGKKKSVKSKEEKKDKSKDKKEKKTKKSKKENNNSKKQLGG
jgi:hypothetical protein